MKKVKISEENILVKCSPDKLLEATESLMAQNLSHEERMAAYKKLGWSKEDINKIRSVSQAYLIDQKNMSIDYQTKILKQIMKDQKIKIWRK